MTESMQCAARVRTRHVVVPAVLVVSTTPRRSPRNHAGTSATSAAAPVPVHTQAAPVHTQAAPVDLDHTRTGIHSRNGDDSTSSCDSETARAKDGVPAASKDWWMRADYRRYVVENTTAP